MDTFIKKQLNIIETDAQDKIDKEKYEKYKYIFDIMIKFLKKRKDILLYGGTAINEILPKKSKIYGEVELPDIDVFTYNYENLINDILKYFKTQHKEIKYVSATIAIHKGTYKVYAEGLQILDITEYSKDIFDLFYKNRIKNTPLGIPVVDIKYLKFSLHLLSSQSYDSHRWNKVLDRTKLLYKHYPTKIKKRVNWDTFIIPDLPNEINDCIKTLAKNNGLMSFGADYFVNYIYKPKTINGEYLKYYVYDSDLNNLVSSIKNKDIKIVKNKGDNFVSSYIELIYNNTHIAYIFYSDNCSSYYTNNKSDRLFTLHSVISWLYKLYFSSHGTFNELIPVINKLSRVSVDNINNKSKFKELYSAECYGHQEGLVTLRRKRLQRKQFLVNKNIYTK